MNRFENNSSSQLQILRDIKGLTSFTDKIKEAGYYPLKSKPVINTLQVNIGKVCNLMCKHCHVEAGPHRTETMSRENMSRCLEIMENNNIPTLDITGGAPELNTNLKWFIKEAKQAGCHVLVRTNLTLLDTEEFSDLAEFYADHNVELVSSLPCYTEENTDGQRGQGVFLSSTNVLSHLNKVGYGQRNGSLKLNLVYNPGGAFLPADQKVLEDGYRWVLQNQYGITFNNLITITNVPVGRFLTSLYNSGTLLTYMKYLANNFNISTVSEVMCRKQVSIGWDGQIYDCDFNQMLGLNCSSGHIKNFSLAVFKEREIVLGNHCYACTAGAGSSCGGAILENTFPELCKPAGGISIN